MSFSANLQHLRATRSMTQEQLAMLLGVSRQAVSKWESDAAYPEMDKLLCLCDIFECSLDELARGDLTHRTREHALAVSPGPATDICDYDRRMRLRATLTASGVACIFLGIAGFCGTGGIAASAADAYRIACQYAFFAGTLLACVLFGFACNVQRTFTRRHPFVEDFYTEADKARARKRRNASWAAAAVITVVSVAICWFQTVFFQHLYGGLASLNIALAGASWLVVHASMGVSRTDIAAYNRRYEEKAARKNSEARRLSLIAGRDVAARDAYEGFENHAAADACPQVGCAPSESALAPSAAAMPHGAQSDAGACPSDTQSLDANMLYQRVREQRKAAAGIIMTLSAIVVLVMLFVLHSPHWPLALIIGALACVIAWIAIPFRSVTR